MTLFKPQSGQAGSPTAFSATISNFENTFAGLYGNVVLNGMTVGTNKIVAVGNCIVGHMLTESLGSVLTVVGSGTFDVYACVPTSTISTGLEAPVYQVIPTGTQPSQPGVILATISVSSGTITSVTDKRPVLVAPTVVNAMLTRMMTKETTINELSAPLPAPVMFVAPSALKVTSVALYALTAPTGSPITVRVKKGSLDLFTSGNYPTILTGALIGKATPDGSGYNMVADDVLTVDLTSAPTSGGTPLTIILNYQLV